MQGKVGNEPWGVGVRKTYVKMDFCWTASEGESYSRHLLN